MQYPLKNSSYIKKGILQIIAVLALSGINITFAQITQPTAWTKAYDQVSGTGNTYSFPIAAGTNRILAVCISQTFLANATQAIPTTITYGGTPLTLATTNGATSGRMHTWIYFLKDNAIMNGTAQPLNVTLAGTHLNFTVWYGVFAGVDQSPATYTTGNGLTNTAGSGPAQLSTAMAVNANVQAIYYSCVHNTANVTIPAYTINANWTSGGISTGTSSTTNSWKNEVAKRTIPVANTTDNAATSAIAPAGNNRWAMSAISLPMAVSVLPTLTLANPTTPVGSASLCGSGIKVPIHAFNITCSGGASILTNFQFTTSGTYVASDLANYKLWWNSTNALGTASLLATNSTPGGSGLKTFTAFSLNIPVTTTYYFWITIDIAASPFSGHTLTVGSSVSTDMTTAAIKAGGPTAASGTQTVNSIPATPGIISGLASQPPLTGGLNYSIAAVNGATTYSWLVPAGWSITGGQGTSGITVTSGAIGQNGNISVTAGNICGTSAASLLAVTSAIPDPHGNACNQCHINHTSPGGQLTSIIGNANLCISCHNPAGSASLKPFANSDKAIPGTSGTSHAWDKNAFNATYQTNMPTNTAMLARINSGQIICSTCHDQHSQTYYPYLRADNSGDALCKDCHSARNLGTYLSNTATNKSSHPVGITYNGADPRFLSNPALPIVLVSSKVECSSCHKTHYAGSSDGNILRMTYDETLCQSCHTPKTATSTMEHKGMTCVTCHDPHQSGSVNIYLIRDNIVTPYTGTQTTVFTENTSGSNYADGTASFNGVCEVCHTLTDHYTNTSLGTTDARHMVNPVTKCVTCHPHNKGFAAQTDCFACHNAITDKPSVPGTRRQIVDNLGNGTGTGGDFKRTSHHVTGAIPNVNDCIKCHYMGDHKSGTVKLLDPDQGFSNIYTYDPLNKSSVESFCLKCHDANGSNGDVTPFSDNVTVPLINQAMWTASSHKTAGTVNANTCLACHDNGHGSNKSTLIGPFAYTGPGTGTDLMNEEEGFCLGCHGLGGVATVQVHLSFANANTATAFRKHDPTASYRKHVNEENTGAAFGGTNRHVECVDCHNPHGVKAYVATTAPTIYSELIGASGVTPTYAGAGAPTGFTFNENTTYEYEVCYKCHSSFTTLPTYLPAGWSGTADEADGLKKLTTGGINTQIADSRDMAREYNPANASYHPIMAAGTNLNINAATFQTGWTFTSRMYCTSCHDNTQKATAGYGRGPHGSQNLHILDAGTGGNSGNKTTHNGANTAVTDFCSKCHKAASYISGNTSSRFGYHLYHVANKTQEGCYLCHDTHGSETFHLINFSRNQAGGCITAVTTNTQAAFAHAMGTAANTCNTTCHGTSHGSGKSYIPAYN
ncbi:MAG: cytochrome c3 family protein [Bacteroidales bacterium]